MNVYREREREKESSAPLRARCTGAKALVVGETVGDVDCVHTGRRRHHIGEEVERERRWEGGESERIPPQDIPGPLPSPALTSAELP